MTLLQMPVYEKPPQPSVPYPRFGVGVLPESPAAGDYVNLLNNVITQSINGGTFTVDDGGTDYVYFATPVINGTIEFENLASKLRGGWDGAKWPTDGSISTELGPIIVNLTFFGDTARDWYIYRTDFPGNYVRTYAIYYDNPPTQLKGELDDDPGVGFGQENIALINPTQLVVDGPTVTVKSEGQQFIAFEYDAKPGYKHIHNAIGTGNLTVRLYNSSRVALLPTQNSNNGPNGSDEIEYEYNSTEKRMLLLVFCAEPRGTFVDCTVNVISSSGALSSTGQYDIAGALNFPTNPATTGQLFTLNIGTFEEVIAIPFTYDGTNGGKYEVSITQPSLANGKIDVKYHLYTYNSMEQLIDITGLVNINSGPSGRDEINTHNLPASSSTAHKNDIFLVLITDMRENTGAVHLLDVNFNIQHSIYSYDGAENDAAYRSSMSHDKSVLVVGSPGSDPNSLTDMGAVYVYIENNGQYDNTQKIIFPNPSSEVQDVFGDRFGFRVKVSGDGQTLLISSIFDSFNEHTKAGSVLIYKRIGNLFVFLTRVFSPVPRKDGQFGYSLDCTSDAYNVFIGTLNEQRVYNYTHDGNSFIYNNELFPKLIRSGDLFGSVLKLSFDGNRLYVAAPKRENKGYIFIFDKGSSWTSRYEDNLFSFTEDSGNGEHFGQDFDVSLDNTYMLVGSRYQIGKGAVHEMTEIEGVWTQTDLIAPSFDHKAYFGWRVVLDSAQNIAYISTYSEKGDLGISNQGSITKWEKTSGWNEISKSRPPQLDWPDTYWGLELYSVPDKSMLIVGSNVPKYAVPPIDLRVRFGKAPPPMPRYGIGNVAPGFNSFAQLSAVLNNQPTFTSGQTITLNASTNQYMYFAIPVERGSALFIDTSNGYQGAWDGASWPNNGNIGTMNGPVNIVMDDGNGSRNWYVYRTDFPSLGTKTFQVNIV